MNFLKLAKTRYSVRTYTEKPIERDKIDYILECARVAPSATNAQPWHLYVITDINIKKELLNSYPRDWFEKAPLYIVVCVNEDIAWVRNSDKKNHADIDGAIIAEHICLAAADCGLGSCWVCNFNPEICSDVLALPTNLKPIALIPIGYPSTDEIPDKKRKSLSEIVTIK